VSKSNYIQLYLTQQRILKPTLDFIQDIGRLFLPKANKLKPPKKEFDVLNQRFEKLLERDISNVINDKYSKKLLLQIPFLDYISKTPLLLKEVSKMYFKVKNNTYNDLPKDVELTKYPNYFTRNFHWQSDGYFSLNSAKIYDLGVEFLFLGTADIMRRQSIPPITDFLKDKDISKMKLLDVACGTSRTIYQINKIFPKLNITAIDLSPYYLEYSKGLFKNKNNITFVNANAEEIPFENESFDIITCTYLFHELPRNTRLKVLSEIYRVLNKNGLLVIQDSAQLSESDEIKNILFRFAKEFHEPYYKDYIQNNLDDIINTSGFEVLSSEPHYVSKVVVARKV
jgi:ubiquinone/menaquinone biosynthesis C-methylase UbiE